MRRREFLGVLGGAAGAWPIAARAQQPERVRRVGVLMGTASDDPERRPVSRRCCKDCRRPAGQSAATHRWISAGAPAIALACVSKRPNWLRSNPDVVVAGTGSTIGPLQQASRTVPLVFAQQIDPVGTGTVETLSRPNSNATGFLRLNTV